MPLYEDKKNAENIIRVSEAAKKSVVFGTENVIQEISRLIVSGCRRIALDGWYGVAFDKIIEALRHELLRSNTDVQFVNIKEVFKPVAALQAYKQPFVTDDPGFGYVNDSGQIEDLMDPHKLSALQEMLKDKNNGTIVVYHYGAAVPSLMQEYENIIYFDKTMQPLLWEMWDGKLIPFGFDHPDKEFNWKEYYYCDFYLLFRHKKMLYEQMSFYVEAIEYDTLKMIPRTAYDEIISTCVQYPIKQVQIFQPGPWGAYRYRDLWDIPGLECSAWNKMSGPELSVLIDFGAEALLNLPLQNLMQYGENVVGKKFNDSYPDLFPLDIWLDDGYFPEKQPAERTSMPIHNHPGSDYVKKHFNEPLGRYETYYIAEAYEGANTWMGYHDEADLELWEKKCNDSNNLVPIEDWKEFICNWKSNTGDLYLIPPGTVHGHGGNQMVLEMDTSPSIAGTEYSFFQYDFARNSWDDDKKEMTGKPLKMHLDHGFDNEKWRRKSYVEKHLRARPEIVSWNKMYWVDKYSSLPEMPFEVMRIFFDKNAEHSTEGVQLQILTLTVGHSVTIRSKANPSLFTRIDRLQCVAIPACFGDYEIVSDDQSFCTVVCFFLKQDSFKI